MPLLAFLLEAVLISLSGVMAPGPMTAVTVGKGSESPHAGAFVALGHGIVEIPLMLAIFYGFGAFFSLPHVRTGIAAAGGLFMLVMGVGMLRALRTAEIGSRRDARSPLAVGVLLSAGNPYFLIWWATVGAALISRSVTYGLIGLAALAVVHWTCDLLWLYVISTVSFRGRRSFGLTFQRVIFAISGVMLVFFGVRFMLDAARALMGGPQ